MTSTPRLLFSTGSLYVYDLSLAFQLSAEAGFDGVEVMCDERYSTRHREYLQQLSDQHNQPIHVLHTPFSPRLPGWYNAQHDQIERITQTLKLAEKLNAAKMGTEHLLLALLKEEGSVAYNALHALGCSFESIHEAVVNQPADSRSEP